MPALTQTQPRAEDSKELLQLTRLWLLLARPGAMGILPLLSGNGMKTLRLEVVSMLADRHPVWAQTVMWVLTGCSMCFCQLAGLTSGRKSAAALCCVQSWLCFRALICTGSRDKLVGTKVHSCTACFGAWSRSSSHHPHKQCFRAQASSQCIIRTPLLCPHLLSKKHARTHARTHADLICTYTYDFCI